jgi:hypothetical protein
MKTGIKLIGATLVVATFLFGCTQDTAPVEPGIPLNEDMNYGVAGIVYDGVDETEANPVPDCECTTYCWDCGQFVFDSDISGPYGVYWCWTTNNGATAHNNHEMTVWGSTDGMTLTHESHRFEFTAPNEWDINLHPAGGA